jgi:hypothetical protein
MASPMAANTLVICGILDRLGSPNSFSTTSPLEVNFTGDKTTELVALEQSLRNVVRRFQDLERKLIAQTIKPEKIRAQGQIHQNIGDAQPRNILLPTPPEEVPLLETAGSLIPSITGPRSNSNCPSFAYIDRAEFGKSGK